MNIKQFKDEPLSHYSYAIFSEGKIALVDPGRNPYPYYLYAEEMGALIVAVFETHPHADFISSHLQIHLETGAVIYTSKISEAAYPHEEFDEGSLLEMGNVIFRGINTPGHSPDSITIVAESKGQMTLFTGDTLFIGDVGRPDLREKEGDQSTKRLELAKAMYHTIQDKFSTLPDKALVYPAHGAGSLCGKNLSDAASSTLGMERIGNWAFKQQTEEDFVSEILNGQPFIPSYFGFNVDTNREGAEIIFKAFAKFDLKLHVNRLEHRSIIVDIRDSKEFKKGRLPNSINIMSRDENDKFETWLGSIIHPNEPFYIVVSSVEDVDSILERTAKIGYERQLVGIVTLSSKANVSSPQLDLKAFKNNIGDFTVVDIRNSSELEKGRIFEKSITIPLNELRNNFAKIPVDKSIVVHCEGGYRSAAGSSILENLFPDQKVYDLGDAVKEFK